MKGKLIHSILTALFLVALQANCWALPTARVISHDTAYCVTGSAPFTVKFSGTPPFGIIYTITYSDGTSSGITYEKISQANWIQIDPLNQDSTWTVLLSNQTKSYSISIDKVFDSTMPMSGSPATWDDIAQGEIVVNQKMAVRVDNMPIPYAGKDTAVCAYATQLLGKKSVASNKSIWWSTTTGYFNDSTIEKPTVTIPSQGAYTFWFKEIAGTCKDSTPVNYQFHGYAKATLSGTTDICASGEIAASLVSTGSYPLTYKYKVDGTTISPAQIVSSTPYAHLIPITGNKTVAIYSITDKNNCISPSTALAGSANSIDLLPHPQAGQDQIVCGDSLSLTATTDIGQGWWSGPGRFDDSTSMATKFHNNSWGHSIIQWNEIRKGCKGTSSLSAEFFKQPKAHAGANQLLFLDLQTSLAATLPLPEDGIGTWSTTAQGVNIESPNQYDTKVLNLAMGETTFKWRMENGVCPMDSDEVIIDIKGFTYSSGFTPNGDGINDVFEIFGLIQRPVANNEIKIFDSSGLLKYTQKNYDNGWTGVDQAGNKLPDGAYYFFFTGDGIESVKSYVIIKSE